MISVGINGISGRMGKTILKILLEKQYKLGAAFEAMNNPNINKDAASLIYHDNLGINITTTNEDDILKVDGIIDFSSPESSLALVEIAKRLKKPLVIGTTGFNHEEKKIIDDASRAIPLLFSPNMSVGVNILFKLTEIASKILGNDFDIEIFEAHHKFKKDAPSGTAKKLLDIIKDNLCEVKDPSEVYDRSETTQERKNNELGVMSLRGGDIVGEHTVYLIGMGERIELTHRASNREIFARGAVLGLEYLVGRKPGLYNMYNVLGI